MKNLKIFFDRENFDLKIAKHKSPIMRLKIPKSTKDEKGLNQTQMRPTDDPNERQNLKIFSSTFLDPSVQSGRLISSCERFKF